MSRSEDFLSRWSRRKQEAAKEASLPAKEPEQGTEREEAAAADAQLPATAESARPEPLFDLSKLPSLDSIGPATDVSIFMQPGVPPSLARAALRRAWSADPAIRDFVGLSENAWDFTKPDSIAGFGPLLPIDDVKRLLAQVLKDEKSTHEDVSKTALQHDSRGPSEQLRASQEPEIVAVSVALETDSAAQSESVVHCTEDDLASHETEPAKISERVGDKRRHGGALPS